MLTWKIPKSTESSAHDCLGRKLIMKQTISLAIVVSPCTTENMKIFLLSRSVLLSYFYFLLSLSHTMMFFIGQYQKHCKPNCSHAAGQTEAIFISCNWDEQPVLEGLSACTLIGNHEIIVDPFSRYTCMTMCGNSPQVAIRRQLSWTTVCMVPHIFLLLGDLKCLNKWFSGGF